MTLSWEVKAATALLERADEVPVNAKSVKTREEEGWENLGLRRMFGEIGERIDGAMGGMGKVGDEMKRVGM